MDLLFFESIGERLHPFLASLPLSLLATAFVFLTSAALKGRDLALGRWLLSMVLILVGAAYLSGDFGRDGASKTFEVDGELIAQHQAWAKSLLMVLIVACAVLWLEAVATASRKVLRWLGVALGAVAVLLNLIAGSKGGDLVFKHGAGVSASCAEPLPPAGHEN